MKEFIIKIKTEEDKEKVEAHLKKWMIENLQKGTLEIDGEIVYEVKNGL